MSAPVRRVGIIFAGGPAPAANAVISAAAISFIDHDIDVVGFFHGYSNLMEYHPVTNRLREERHYRLLTQNHLSGLRNARGICIGTARANPGKSITVAKDLDDADKTRALRNVYNALVDMEVDALISIGGDDTLRTANLFHEFQLRLPDGAKRVRIVHLPKTIDNDYRGIDFTFGFFTAVDVMAKELLNLRADAIATSSYFVIETMGRKAGWLSYGVGIAGEASLVLAREDCAGMLDAKGCLVLDKLLDRIVKTMVAREEFDKFYGTIVLAEGLAELLPDTFIGGIGRDEHGHLSLGKMDLGKLVAKMVSEHYEKVTGKHVKVRGVQLGYESRCAAPHAFDVMLGSQLGIGAYRCLVEEGLDAHMVSVEGQLELCYVPFGKLIDDTTLRASVRYIEPGSDFHRLARFLEHSTDPVQLPKRKE